MKKELKKKLVLNKITLADLNSFEKQAVRGGLTAMANLSGDVTCPESCGGITACCSDGCSRRPCTRYC